jgi:hypothetical protein
MFTVIFPVGLVSVFFMTDILICTVCTMCMYICTYMFVWLQFSVVCALLVKYSVLSWE